MTARLFNIAIAALLSAAAACGQTATTSTTPASLPAAASQGATETASAPAGDPAASTTTASATAAATSTATTQAQSGEEDSALPQYYQAMVDELRLGRKQQALLRDRVRKMLEALEDFDSKNGETIEALQQGVVQAHKDKDGKLRDELLSQLEKLSKQRKAIIDSHDKQILSILNRKQRKVWDAYLLFADALKPLSPLMGDSEVALTERQITMIRNVCSRRAAKLAALGNDANRKARFYDELFKYIRQRILTAEQRAALEGGGTTQPASSKATARD